MLPWSFVEELMTAARDYWLATVLPTGGPHLTPVWGLWVEGAFYFGSGQRTRKARNLAGNPNVAVHPQSDDVVIIEGVVETVTDPSLAARVYTASTAKYGFGSRDIEGSYAVRPRVCSPGPRAASRTPPPAGSSTEAPPSPGSSHPPPAPRLQKSRLRHGEGAAHAREEVPVAGLVWHAGSQHPVLRGPDPLGRLPEVVHRFL